MNPVHMTHQRPLQTETFPAKLTKMFLTLMSSEMGSQQIRTVKRLWANVTMKAELVGVLCKVQLQGLPIGEVLSTDRTHEVLFIGVSLHMVSQAVGVA